MDPNKALETLRSMVAADSILGSSEFGAIFKGLDIWLVDGGSLPDDWKI
jgi:hypothetical protein